MAVFAGLGFMMVGGASNNFIIANGVTLLAVMLLIWMIPAVVAVRAPAIMAVIIAILMTLSLVSNMAIDGVQRWLPLGPLRLHAGMLLIPTLVVIVPKIDRRIALAVLISIAVIISLQPDFASAMALALSTIVIALSLRSKWMVIAAVIALGSLAFTMFNMVELSPVRFVEEVVPSAWLIHPLLAVALITSLATAIVWPIRRWWFVTPSDRIDHTERLTFSACIAGYVVASAVGSYPVPLLGYGASAIIGYGLAVIFFTAQPISRSSGAAK